MAHFELEASLSLGHNKLHSIYSSDQCCSGISSHFLQMEFIAFKGQFKAFCLLLKINCLHDKNFHKTADGLTVLNYLTNITDVLFSMPGLLTTDGLIVLNYLTNIKDLLFSMLGLHGH